MCAVFSLQEGSAQAAGGDRQEEAPRPSEAVAMSTRRGDGKDEKGFLSPTNPSAEKERETENADETSRLGDQTGEAASSAVPIPVTRVELPQGGPQVSDGKAPLGSQPEADKGPSDADQQPVPPLEKGKEGDVSSPSDSSPPMVSATAAVPHGSVDGVRTMSSVPAVSQEDVQDQVQLSSPLSSPPTSVESTVRPAEASLGTVRAMALSEAGQGGQGNEKSTDPEGSEGPVEAPSGVAAAAGPSTPVAEGDSQHKGDVPPSESVGSGPRKEQADRGETGSSGQDGVASPQGGHQQADREEVQDPVPQNQEHAEPQQQHQQQQQQEQQKPQNDQTGEQGNQTPSPTSSTTITTTTSDSATTKGVGSSTLAVLAVVPFLLTA